MNRIQSVALLLAGTSAFALPAFAQTTPAPALAAAVPSSDEVVVTGSRVIRNGNNSPTPVTVVPIDDALRTQPTTVADALNDLPVFSGSRTPLGNPNVASGTVQNGGGNSGANILNLRNMGQNRTLILYDGRRMGPVTATGLVDVDMIPQMLLQRVDVVTGGVSAVYGSDAVTGVVNFVTDKTFNGFKAKAQFGETQLGEDRNENFGFAAGRELFGGRGHVEFSYEYRNDPGIDARSDLDPTHQVWSVQGSGTAAAPYFLTANARQQSSTFGGLINSGVLTGMTFDQNGVLSPFVHGTPTVPGSTTSNEIGGDGIYYDSQLKASLQSHQVFGRFDYDVTDTTHAYVEVAWNKKDNNAYIFWQNLSKATLSATDPFLAPTYQAQLIGAKQATFTLSKQMMDVSRQYTSNESDETVINAGLSGDLGMYKWDGGFLHTDGRLYGWQRYNTNNARQAAALDAVTNPATGQIVCNVTLTNPTLYPGCVPLNPFGPTTDSQAALDWIGQPTALDIRTAMNDLNGSVSGAPFSTWAGPVNIAVSGEWRTLSEYVLSSAPTGALADCTGLRFNCTATTTAYANQVAPRPNVTQTVIEGAFETDIPVLKDVFLARALNINGAVRVTNYSTKGTYVPWKIGVDWHVNDEIRLRGTRSQDIRAPTLDDLYSPTSSSISTGSTLDRLTGNTVTGVIQTVTSNPNLTAEVGHTWTGGVVYRPSWFSGFSLSLDYFDITVDNSIVAILSSNVTAQIACASSGGLSPYCAAVVRPLPYSNTTAANNLTQLISLSINVAEQYSNGLDLEANYATKFLDRPASIRVLSTWQPNILYVQPATVTLNQAGAAYGSNGVTAAPVWRFTGMVRFMPIDNLTLDFQTRWRSSLHEAGDPTLVFSCCAIPAVTFVDATATYQIKNDVGLTEMFFNVSNLFDTYGPHAAPFTNSAPGQQYGYVTSDDPLGRSFVVGVRFKH